MKRSIPLLTILLLFISVAQAADLTVNVLEKEIKVMSGSNKTAFYTLEITNNEQIADSFEIFSLAGVSIRPVEPFTILSNQTITKTITLIPHEETKKNFRGIYLFEYQIKGFKSKFYTNRLSIDILDFKDIIDAQSNNVLFDDSTAKIKVINKGDLALNDIIIMAKSPFYSGTRMLNLKPQEIQEIEFPINKENIQGLAAGSYQATITLQLSDSQVKKTSSFKFLEKEGSFDSQQTSGIIIRRTILTKSNEGNVDTQIQLNYSQNILSRLFTSFSEQPGESSRKGLVVSYSWQNRISPGQSYLVEITTNYTIPFLLFLIILAVIIISIILSKRDFSFSKHVNYVKTKSDDFALKITLTLKARKSIKNIHIIDRVPHSTKLYQKFTVHPEHVDSNSRTIKWKIPHLHSGEERTITYIVYSKMKIVGTFGLPQAQATFEKDGEKKTIYSNKTSFAAETIDTSS